MLEKEIKVDAIAPQFEMTASAGFAVWYQKEAKLHVRGMDRESGIQEIVCYVDGVYEGEDWRRGSVYEIFRLRMVSE